MPHSPADGQRPSRIRRAARPVALPFAALAFALPASAGVASAATPAPAAKDHGTAGRMAPAAQPLFRLSHTRGAARALAGEGRQYVVQLRRAADPARVLPAGAVATVLPGPIFHGALAVLSRQQVRDLRDRPEVVSLEPNRTFSITDPCSGRSGSGSPCPSRSAAATPSASGSSSATATATPTPSTSRSGSATPSRTTTPHPSDSKTPTPTPTPTSTPSTTPGKPRAKTYTWGRDRTDQRKLPLDHRFRPPADGLGVHVFVIDSGIDLRNRDFTGRIGAGAFSPLVGDSAQDCNGHGTHVSGTIGSSRFGMARTVTLHPVRIASCKGGSTLLEVVAAVDWVARNAQPRSIVNMSLGGPLSDILNEAVDALASAGIPVIVAAGNEAEDACLVSPASALSVVSVGAVDRKDKEAPFSNFGTCVDLYAPGVGIRSTRLGGGKSGIVMTGTSMASPHVAGAAAIFWALHPLADADQVLQGLEQQATEGVLTIGSAVAGSPNANLNVLFRAASPSPTPSRSGSPTGTATATSHPTATTTHASSNDPATAPVTYSPNSTTTQSGGTPAYTGSQSIPMAALGVGLVVVGGLAIAAPRRLRRRYEPQHVRSRSR